MPPKLRAALDFFPEARARLDALKELTQADTYAEVLANAIQLYDNVVTEGGQDAMMLAPQPDGTNKITRLFKSMDGTQEAGQEISPMSPTIYDAEQVAQGRTEADEPT